MLDRLTLSNTITMNPVECIVSATAHYPRRIQIQSRPLPVIATLGSILDYQASSNLQNGATEWYYILQ